MKLFFMVGDFIIIDGGDVINKEFCRNPDRTPFLFAAKSKNFPFVQIDKILYREYNFINKRRRETYKRAMSL